MQDEGLHEVRIKIKRKDVDSESVSKNAYDSSEFWAKEETTQRKEDDCGIYLRWVL